jgi:predicted site-specific integrase-resolvase
MQATFLPEKAMFRPDEVANLFSVSIRTVANWRSEGKLEGVHLSDRCIRFPRKELLIFLSGTT